MKLGVAVFLGLALGGTSLTAQQSLLASAPLPPVPLSEFALPAPPASAPAKLPETAPKLAATVGVGLPNVSLYESIEPQTPAAVCAQLRPFSFTEAEMSSYAFSKAQFSHDIPQGVVRARQPGEDGAQLCSRTAAAGRTLLCSANAAAKVRLVPAQHALRRHGLQHHGRRSDRASLGRLADLGRRDGRLRSAFGRLGRGRRSGVVLQRISSSLRCSIRTRVISARIRRASSTAWPMRPAA